MAYPLTYPDNGDPRFTDELLDNISAVLAAHGYPPVDDVADHADLRDTLYDFLYGAKTVTARYSWLATLSWVMHGSMYTATFTGVATSDGTLSRASVLQQIRDLAAQEKSVPQDANVLLFNIDPEMLPGGAL